MTNPEDPFATPGGQPTPSQPPAYGQPPAAGQPPRPTASPRRTGSPGIAANPPGSAPRHGPGRRSRPGAPGSATLLDYLIALGLAIAGGIVAGTMHRPGINAGHALIVLVLGYVGVLGFHFWQLAVQGRTGSTNRQEPDGHSRVLREQDGQVIGLGLSIGRYFVHYLDGLCLLGYLWPLWDAKKQTFADKILTTVVIKG